MESERSPERIPFLDLHSALASIAPELRTGFDAVIDSGRVLEGEQVAGFEAEWAAYCSAPRAIGVGSGTDALRLILVALGVGPQDEVIVPAFTAVPTAAAVCATGATPVFADVDHLTGALDPDAARAALTERTRAVIVVHLYGRPAEIPDLGVPVIEDAAHAHGALGEVTGVATAYSFYPTKNLGALGDGGMVVTADHGLADEIESLRVHGRMPDGLHHRPSTNSRLSEIAAMSLRVQLPHLGAGNRRRNEIAREYRRRAPALGWQADHERHVHHLCVLRAEDRDSFRARLPCETGLHYPTALPDEPAYARYARDPAPVARAWASSCVSIPCHPALGDAEVEQIADALAAIG